ncbi:MAG TPA: alpha-1,2-fucosyltransferase [Bacteroidia bacterium]|jgi:hypothetical protein|nr:alpha-1,2-fucosyltransferase [Bacteroidia bacterium]
MIAVRLKGGMGNQMFQYAAGRSLAQHLNTSLFVDLSFLRLKGTWTPREYELGVFAARPQFLSPEEAESFLKLYSDPMRRRTKRFLPFLYSKTYFPEKHFQFDPLFFEQKDNTYIEGYWQSEKYFKRVESLIRTDFTFREPAGDRNARLASDMRSGETVSLHIRRGDYVKDAGINSFHGVCDIGYYKQAVEYLNQRNTGLRYFVFSDDADWAREHLSFIPGMTCVDHNHGAESYRDMQLMSCCKHHIIANSSFSWWGAWLGENEKKTVIAPEKWFQQPGVILSDIYPSGWIKL